MRDYVTCDYNMCDYITCVFTIQPQISGPTQQQLYDLDLARVFQHEGEEGGQ